MAITHTFEFGSAKLFLHSEKSCLAREATPRSVPSSRSVTLFVQDPGDMFIPGRLQQAQRRVKLAAEAVYGVSTGVVNLERVTLYDRSITSYEKAVEVATDFVNVFNEQFKQLLTTADQASSVR